jgi:hypothetical protein
MTSDHSAHTAWHAPDRNGWEVSWLPGQILDRNTAITTMVLADTAGSAALHHSHRLWSHLEGWAAELRLTAPNVIARTARSPGSIGTEKDAAAELVDPEAAGS